MRLSATPSASLSRTTRRPWWWSTSSRSRRTGAWQAVAGLRRRAGHRDRHSRVSRRATDCAPGDVHCLRGEAVRSAARGTGRTGRRRPDGGDVIARRSARSPPSTRAAIRCSWRSRRCSRMPVTATVRWRVRSGRCPGAGEHGCREPPGIAGGPRAGSGRSPRVPWRRSSGWSRATATTSKRPASWRDSSTIRRMQRGTCARRPAWRNWIPLTQPHTPRSGAGRSPRVNGDGGPLVPRGPRGWRERPGLGPHGPGGGLLSERRSPRRPRADAGRPRARADLSPGAGPASCNRGHREMTPRLVLAVVLVTGTMLVVPGTVLKEAEAQLVRDSRFAGLQWTFVRISTRRTPSRVAIAWSTGESPGPSTARLPNRICLGGSRPSPR